MSKYPAPSREHHDDFCTTEKWALVRGASGKPVKHHRTYELGLWDGRILRTRISKPINGSTYGARVWSHILREQLDVTPEVFWDCALHSVVPDRGAPSVSKERSRLPLHLYRLLADIGLNDDEIAGLNAAEAAAKVAAFYAGQA